jgi:hypothetical protein
MFFAVAATWTTREAVALSLSLSLILRLQSSVDLLFISTLARFVVPACIEVESWMNSWVSSAVDIRE